MNDIQNFEEDEVYLTILILESIVDETDILNEVSVKFNSITLLNINISCSVR